MPPIEDTDAETPPDGQQPPADGDPPSGDQDDGSGLHDGATDSDEGNDDGDQVAKLRKEAAGYRKRASEAEAQAEQLRVQVDDYHRRQVEELASETMKSGADLWLAGVGLDDLRGDDGAIDEAKVTDAVKAAVAERPHWRIDLGSADGGVHSSYESGGRSFDEVLRGTVRGR